jgi:hypothetical protein
MSKKEEGGKTREWEAAPHTRNTFPLVPYLLVYATTKPNHPPPPNHHRRTNERTGFNSAPTRSTTQFRFGKMLLPSAGREKQKRKKKKKNSYLTFAITARLVALLIPA